MEVEEYYVPEVFRAQSDDNKQASEGEVELQEECLRTWNDSIEHAKIFYDGLLRRGVAKEQARVILPLSQYTKVWWTASFQSIMNFIELRDEPTAQVEIQDYARTLKKIMLEVYPETTKLWEEVYWK